MKKQTPWGTAQSSTVYAPGIVFYVTAGHGGIELSEKHHQHLLRLLPFFRTFAGGLWYEEDCDICAVAVVFPDLFPRSLVRTAIRQIRFMAPRHLQWQGVLEFIESRNELLAIEEAIKS